MKHQAEACGEAVNCLGWVSGEEKEKYLKECDIFVLPSYFEGQSVAILEAMAYSCAIAASNVGGIPQMIVNGETGVLFQPMSEEALEEGLLKLLSDKAYCQKLGENARNKVEKEFSIETNIKELLEIYERI